MIHLVTAENRHLYADAIAAMHRGRHQHFIRERGWNTLTDQGGLELDEYDTEDALYLIGFDGAGDVAVSARILPADHGSLLSDHFGHLVSEGPAHGAGVFELSRYYAAPSLRGRKHFPVKAAMNLAILEAVVERGARRLVGFTDVQVLGVMRYSGWRVRAIGLPADYPEGTAVAFEIACSPQDLSEMRDAVELPGRQLFEAPGWLPDGADVLALGEATNVILNLPQALSGPVVSAIHDAAESWRPQGDLEALFSRMSQRQAA